MGVPLAPASGGGPGRRVASTTRSSRSARSPPTRASGATRRSRSSQRCKPVFDPDGTTTAGNAPGVNDGASCVVVCSEEFAARRGLEPLATILAQGYVADDFAYLARTPARAGEQALVKAGKTIDDVVARRDQRGVLLGREELDPDARRRRGDRERQRRRGCARAPDRRVRRSDRDDDDPRAPAIGRRARARRDLLGRRAGRRAPDRGLKALLLIPLAALALASPAAACVCVDAPMGERLDDADAAVVGRVVAERPGELNGLRSSSSRSRSSSESRATSSGRSKCGRPRERTATSMCRATSRSASCSRALPTASGSRTACSVVNPGQLVVEGGEPRGGPIKVVIGIVILALVLLWALRRLRKGSRPELPGAPRAVDGRGSNHLAWPRAVRARPGCRRGPDGRRDRAGRRGFRSARVAPRRASRRRRSGAGGDGEEPHEARGEGRPGRRGRPPARDARRRHRRRRPPRRGGRRGRRREGGDLPASRRTFSRPTRSSRRTRPRSRSRRSPPSPAVRRRSSACTSSIRCPC